MSTREAATAALRFGLGARPDEAKRIASDPRGYLLASLAQKDQALIADGSLTPSHVAYAEMQEAQRAKRAERKAAGGEGEGKQRGDGEAMAARKAAKGAGKRATAGETMADGPAMPDDMREGGAKSGAPGMSAQTPAGGGAGPGAAAKPAANQGELTKPQRIRREIFRAEFMARIETARTTTTPFLERLVMFWSNHFSVSARKVPVMALAGAFEREAIRPHVLGRFADMLLAVEQHPAMLVYLDNVGSIGPNSRAGQNRQRGLNENLAREILELHTLGVDGGYTQDDVTNLARLITGWTVGNVNQPETIAGRFFFAKNRHEPGTWSIAGKTYRSGNENAGRQCLLDLAKHPSTARHIARKLARHFVADTPPPALVARLEASFRDSGGDLAALATALVMSDEAWKEPPRKIVPPYDFLVSVARGFELNLPAPEIFRLSAALGQPLWRPPSPKGWPDDDDAWMAPAALRERLRFAERAAQQIAQAGGDPRDVGGRLLGERLAETTRTAIARAETRAQGFELLMMSPEFQRR